MRSSSKQAASLCFVLALWPALRHPQIVAELMEIAHSSAITHLEGELLFELAVDFDPGPVMLSGLSRIFEHWHEEIAQPLELHFTWLARTALCWPEHRCRPC